MLKVIFLVALLFCNASFGALTTNSSRVAIVVGNASYLQARLDNPLNDARAVSSALSEYGFEVYTFLDLSSSRISEIEGIIKDKVSSNTTVVFYYAGHGLQFNGENLLPSIDADFTKPNSIQARSIRLDVLLEVFAKARPKAAVVVLDACRDNPFQAGDNSPQDRGLARAVAPPASVIFYATRPGSTASDGVGKNGLFTEAFLKEVSNPSLPLELLFRRVSNAVFEESKGKQEPWVEGVIRQEIILARREMSPDSITATASTPNESALNTEAEVSSLNFPENTNIDKEKIEPINTEIARSETLSTLSQAEALRSLLQVDMEADSLDTKYFCEEGECFDYKKKYQELLRQQKFPEMFSKGQRISLCEFDPSNAVCKESVLNHGIGFNPGILFQLILGSRIVTQGIELKGVDPSNGGGFSFSHEKKMQIQRTNVRSLSWIDCPEDAGRIEMLSDRLEFELATSICLPQSPPVPTAFKLSFDVLAYDHTEGDYYVRWRAKHYSIGYFSSSKGFAKVSFRH